MAGRDPTQKRKNDTKSLVLVPEDLGMLLGRSAYLVQIERIMSVTHSPVEQCSISLTHPQFLLRMVERYTYLLSSSAHHTIYTP